MFEEDADDLVEKLLWKISGRQKHRKYIIWQALFTFGAALTLIAAFSDLNIVFPFYVRSLYGALHSSFVCYYTLF